MRAAARSANSLDGEYISTVQFMLVFHGKNAMKNELKRDGRRPPLNGRKNHDL
jgi:hypothetical protein